MKKKLIAALLSLTMGASLAGCQNNAGETDAGSKAAAVTENMEAESNFNPTGYPIVNESITLDIVWQIRDIDTLVPYEEMWCNQQLEELTNIKANVTFIKGNDFDTKLNLMFASGDLPDVIVRAGSDLDVEEYGVTQKLIIPLDNLIDQYMPIYKERVQMEPEDVLIGVRASDGQMYAAASSLGAQNINVVQHYFINQTWLDALGLEEPKTVEELTEVLRAFKTQDPNGNGVADEIPYGIRFESDANSIDGVMAFFGIPKKTWANADGEYLYIDDDRTVQFVPFAEGFRDCMEWLNMAYTEGLLDPEMFTMDTPMLETKIADGAVGYFSSWRLLGTTYQDWAADHAAFTDPVAADGYKTSISKTLELAKGGAYITTANEHVPETMRWLDAQMETETMFNMFAGNKEEGDNIGWKYNDEGKIEVLVTGGEGVAKTFLDVNGLFFAPGSYYFDIYEMAPHRIEKRNYCADYNTKGFIQKYSNDMLGLTPRTSEEMARCTLLQTDINNAVEQYMANFITQGVSEDSWNAFISMFDKMHIEEYISIFQNALDKLELDGK